MKQLHRANLFAWSVFDEPRNVDFNSVLPFPFRAKGQRTCRHALRLKRKFVRTRGVSQTRFVGNMSSP